MPLDFPNSPATDETYTFGGVTWKYDGAKWRLLADSGPAFVTSLPGSPVDGQEIYYQASGDMTTQGIVWHLRYRSAARSGSGAWEFVGGPPMFDGPEGEITTASTTYVALTNGPTLTVPQQGTYLVTMELSVSYERTGADASPAGQSWAAGVSVGGASPTQFLAGAMIDNFEYDNSSKTQKVSYSTNDALSIRIKVDQVNEVCRFHAGTISLVPRFLY